MKRRDKVKCEKCTIAQKEKVKPYALCDEHRKKYHYDWRRGNKDSVLTAQRKYHQKVKNEVLGHYSNGIPKCDCCGETNVVFLTIDHIDGGGKEHNRYIRGRLAAWLRRTGYPNGFQVLCFNCNCGRSINKGICPHELTRSKN